MFHKKIYKLFQQHFKIFEYVLFTNLLTEEKKNLRTFSDFSDFSSQWNCTDKMVKTYSFIFNTRHTAAASLCQSTIQLSSQLNVKASRFHFGYPSFALTSRQECMMFFTCVLFTVAILMRWIFVDFAARYSDKYIICYNF